MKPKIQESRRSIKYALSLPPYQALVEHTDYMLNKYTSEKYLEDDVSSIKRINNLISKDLNKDVNEMLRIIEIEKDLIKLIENTNNKIFYRKLFFPSVFINNDLKFENWAIKGIFVQECLSSVGEGVRYSGQYEDIEANDYIITISCIGPTTGEFWDLTFFLVDDTPSKNDKEDDPKVVKQYIRNIICNIVDMVEGNDADLDCITIETTKEQNEKRIRRGKIAFPTKIYIRAKGKFKTYIKRFNTDFDNNIIKKLGYQFLVRGHWMNFRSPRYVHKIGERAWVKPFWKGEGIIISKDYKLIQETDKLDNQKENVATESDIEKVAEISLENNLSEEIIDTPKKPELLGHDPEKEIDISLEERMYAPRNINSPVRDVSFRERILNVYNDRCAICGIQMDILEACHIIPVEDNGTDEIINGIALCPNHHKTFDSGLIWINEEYGIVLNHSKIKDIKYANIAGGLDDFIKNSRIGEKIFLPDNHKFYPDPDFLIKKNLNK